MNTTGLEDPWLKPISERIGIYVRNKFFRDPYLQRMKHPNHIEELTCVPLVQALHEKDKVRELQRKYKYKYYMSDFVWDNKIRFLFFNFIEIFSFKNGSINHGLKSFSKGLFKGALGGMTLNNIHYCGIFGLASLSYHFSDFSVSNYFITLVLTSYLLSPLQYLTFDIFYYFNKKRPIHPDQILDKPHIDFPLRIKIMGESVKQFKPYYFATASMVSTSAFGVSVYLYNSSNELLNYLYYPSLFVSYMAIKFSGDIFLALQRFKTIYDTNIWESYNIRKVNKKMMFAYVLMNSLFPIEIEQLRGDDYIRKKHTTLMGNTEAFKEREPLYL